MGDQAMNCRTITLPGDGKRRREGRVPLWLAAAMAFGVGALPMVARAAAPPPISEFALPTSGALPFYAVAGPDGNIWFTEIVNSAIGRINVASPNRIVEFPTPTAFSAPLEIAAGPDGNLWFTENAGNRIGRITPTGQITEFSVPRANSGPAGIVGGPDGNLWFTESQTDRIGRVTPTGGFTDFKFPAVAKPGVCRAPHDIVSGPDGNLWFTESSNGNCQPGPQTNTCGPAGASPCLYAYQHIGRITPQGLITEFPTPTKDAVPFGMTAGPDGNVWFTEFSGNNIGRVSVAAPHIITEFPLPMLALPAGTTCLSFPTPATCSDPQGITSGPEGKLWFTESNTARIGSITPAGSVTEVALPASTGPIGVANGPDRNLWWTEGDASKIGRLSLAVTIPTASPGGTLGTVAPAPSTGGAPGALPPIGVACMIVGLLVTSTFWIRRRHAEPMTGGPQDEE